MSTESRNRIIFGAPGTGKSFKLNKEALEKFGEANIERVTFHPNYTYSQFFGTYKPVSTNIDGKKEISYEFVPGPFLRVFTKSIVDKSEYDDYVDEIKSFIQKQNESVENKKKKDFDIFIAVNNLETWDFFKHINHIGQTITWRDNNYNPKIGDFFIMYTCKTNIEESIKKDAKPGVYAIGRYVSEPYVEGVRRVSKIKIYDFSLDEPIISDQDFSTLTENGKFYGYSRVGDEERYKKILKLLEKAKLGEYRPKDQLLIIEEINRANTAAVFGDAFQLLDRNSVGDSEYPISISEDVKQYLEDNGIDTDTLSIPSNMYIWATMNSADQGVLPMDAAFKRRWDFEYLGIDEGEDTIKDVYIQNGDTKINWNDFRKELNKKLAVQLKVNEDKLLGPWFIKADENNLIDNEKFCSKVLMYLYEDVVKMNPRKLFSNCGEDLRYSEICKQWKQKGSAIFDISITTEKEE